MKEERSCVFANKEVDGFFRTVCIIHSEKECPVIYKITPELERKLNQEGKR